MRRWLFMFVAFLAFIAGLLMVLPVRAQAASAPNPANRCYPGISCPGEVIGMPDWARGSVGWHAWFFWKAPSGTVLSDAYMCSHEAGGCMGQAEALAAAGRECKVATLQSDRLACVMQTYSQRVTWACNFSIAKQSDIQGRLCAESIALRTADAAARGIPWPPKPLRYVVDAATSADGTRPAFVVTAGVRATRSTARATSGQPCDPSKLQLPAEQAGKIWASYGPEYPLGMVALCKVLP